MIVLDTSALVDYLVGGDYFEWAESQVRDASSIHVPHLLDVEVLGALRKLVSRGSVEASGATRAVGALQDVALVRHAHRPLVDEMWRRRANLSASDAAFVCLAHALAAPLVTLDQRLSRVPGLPIQVVAPV